MLRKINLLIALTLLLEGALNAPKPSAQIIPTLQDTDAR
mgnify:CR=1 FL=1